MRLQVNCRTCIGGTNVREDKSILQGGLLADMSCRSSVPALQLHVIMSGLQSSSYIFGMPCASCPPQGWPYLKQQKKSRKMTFWVTLPWLHRSTWLYKCETLSLFYLGLLGPALLSLSVLGGAFTIPSLPPLCSAFPAAASSFL